MRLWISELERLRLANELLAGLLSNSACELGKVEAAEFAIFQVDELIDQAGAEVEDE